MDDDVGLRSHIDGHPDMSRDVNLATVQLLYCRYGT
jgi:hypothetical protein